MISMNVFGTFLTLALVSLPNVFSEESLNCKIDGSSGITTVWKDMDSECIRSVLGQIKAEMNASITYLAMGAHFSQDNVNLPGFAKFFFESASEEREHAIKLIKYLSMRGELTSVEKLHLFPVLGKSSWVSGLDALQKALELEVSVTSSIKRLISVCDEGRPLSDYHITDWLTTEYLEEQYKAQRDLAGKISTLYKLNIDRSDYKHTNLAEFIFDKKLMGMDI